MQAAAVVEAVVRLHSMPSALPGPTRTMDREFASAAAHRIHHKQGRWPRSF